MDNKFIKLISISIFAVSIALMSSGCAKEPSEQDESDIAADSSLSAETAQEPEPEETPAVSPMTDAELDKQINDVDTAIDKVKTSGFEAATLSDKDLGI